MSHGDDAAVDVDLRVIDIECLHESQNHGGEGLMELEQVDVLDLHPGALEHLLGHVHRSGQHDGRLSTDVGERSDLGARLEPACGACFLVADQHRGGAIDDTGRIAGMMHVVDSLEPPNVSARRPNPAWSPITANDGCSAASDCIVVDGRMCSSMASSVMPLTSFTGATEFLK